MTDLEIKQITDPTILQRIYYLRAEIWRDFLKVANLDSLFKQNMYTDIHDNHALHWAIISEDRVLGAARMCIHDTLSSIPRAQAFMHSNVPIPSPIASFNRLVIHPDARGQKLTKRFDQVRVEEAKQRNCQSVVVGMSEFTPPYRVNSLKKIGFQAVQANDDYCDRFFGRLDPYLFVFAG